MIDEDLLEKASEATFTDYSQIENLKDLAEIIISDLLDELEHLHEEFDDYKADIRDNYRQLTYRELL